VFAIAGAGEAGDAAYLDRAVPVDDKVLALAAPLSAANIYRVAVPCAAGRCVNFEDGACQIASRLVRHLQPAVDALPRCAIRGACRWWRQAGAEACRRCPQVATTPLDPQASDLLLAGAAGQDNVPREESVIVSSAS
jgi:hypothetical protein